MGQRLICLGCACMQILHGRGATPILELLGIKHPRVEARSDVVYTAEEVLMPFFHTYSMMAFIGMAPYGSADEARRLLFPVRKRPETTPMLSFHAHDWIDPSHSHCTIITY
jgi:hypothetical protein